MRLNGKTAIITGAARGQGAATAALFVENGATVILADRLVDEGEALAKHFGERARFRPLDVREEASWQAIVDESEGRGEAIDILVNNAAVTLVSGILETSRQQYDDTLSINLLGPFLGVRAVLPGMLRRSRGAIVNISSVNGLRGTAGMSVYDASKWGLRGFTKALAVELASTGVRVNSVHPGTIDTPMLNPDGGDTSGIVAALRVPSGRVGRPQEVAYASLFLASDEASYVSGAELAVDGAWSAGVRFAER